MINPEMTRFINGVRASSVLLTSMMKADSGICVLGKKDNCRNSHDVQWSTCMSKQDWYRQIDSIPLEAVIYSSPFKCAAQNCSNTDPYILSMYEQG